MKRNKIILLIVEGDSDETLFVPLLEYLTKDANIRPMVMGGDPFADYKNSRRSSKDIVGDKIRKFLDENRLKGEDLIYVAFIIDVDGIYVPEDDFVIGKPVNNKNYEYDLKARHVMVDNLDYLKNLSKTWAMKKGKLEPVTYNHMTSNIKRCKIPYGVYFNSLTLEHVTHNEIIDDDRKTVVADDLLDEWESNLGGLLEIFVDRKVAANIRESWETLRVKEWYHSHSNINNLVDKVAELVDRKER